MPCITIVHHVKSWFVQTVGAMHYNRTSRKIVVRTESWLYAAILHDSRTSDGVVVRLAHGCSLHVGRYGGDVENGHVGRYGGDVENGHVGRYGGDAENGV